MIAPDPGPGVEVRGRDGVLALVAVMIAVGAKLAVAASWGLLPVEALAWATAPTPDAPPVAWTVAAGGVLGRSELAVRAVAVLSGLAGLALLPASRDRAFLALWWLGLPPLFLLTLLALPASPLVGLWALALGAACRGGRAWLVAGAAAGLAAWVSPTGAALVPLLLVGSGGRDRWAWAGALLGAALAGPVWPSLAWPAGEATGFGAWMGVQALAVTPFAAAAGLWFAVLGPRGDRTHRLAWWTSAPVLLGHAALSAVAPVGPLASAPAWIGVGLGLSAATGRLGRLAWTGTFVAAFASVAVALHGFRPVIPIPDDPAAHLSQGPLLADAVRPHAVPVGVSHAVWGPAGARPVFTERPEDAALLRFYTGLDARVLDCAEPPPEGALTLTSTGSCAGLPVGATTPVVARDRHGRLVGAWTLSLVGR